MTWRPPVSASDAVAKAGAAAPTRAAATKAAPDGASSAPVRAYLGLGSNLGDRHSYLRGAVEAIPDRVAVSSLYETDPIGGPEQGAYLNLVVELSTHCSARELLELCRELEAAGERVRIERWGPRTIDVDVLWVDGETVDEPDLIVPHPRMFDRAFVMVPLAELAPDITADWEDPGDGEVRMVGSL